MLVDPVPRGADSADLVEQPGERTDRELLHEGEGEPVDEAGVAVTERGADTGGVADDGQLIDQLVVHELGEPVPFSGSRHLLEARLQVAGPQVVEHRTVGGRRAVEGDHRAQPVPNGTLVGEAVVAVHADERAADDLEVGTGPARCGESGRDPVVDHGAEEAGRGHRVQHDAVGDRSRHGDHLRTERPDEDRRRTDIEGLGREQRRHHRVRRERALEGQRRSLLPTSEHGTDRPDPLAHPLDRLVVLGAVAPLDVGPDLGAETEPEAATRECLEVPGGVREMDGGPGERDGDVARHVEAAAERSLHEGDEHVVRSLAGRHAVEPGLANRGDEVAHVGRTEGEDDVDLHAAGP